MELTSTPSWLVSSVGRALYQYRRSYRLKSRTGLNLSILLGLIFTTAQVVFITAKITFIFTSLSAVHIYDFHIFTVKLKKTVQLHPQSPIRVRVMVSASVNTCIEISLFKCDLTGLNEVEMIEILL